tara:strand:- start:2328 stop:2771 length:444 start_codon:yes stop_codon:yes gene_type:complete
MSSFSTASAGTLPPTLLASTQHGSHGAAPQFVYLPMGGASLTYNGAGSVVRMLNVTGRGIIQGLYFGCDSTTTSSSIELTIDGVSVYSDSSLSNLRDRGYSPVGGCYCDVTNNVFSFTLAAIPFNTSFTVDASCNLTSILSYKYYLT